MGVHAYHDALPGFSPAQVLHDGCDECEERGAETWNRDGLPDLAKAEVPTLRVLWAVQLHLERYGIPVGEVPHA